MEGFKCTLEFLIGRLKEGWGFIYLGIIVSLERLMPRFLLGV